MNTVVGAPILHFDPVTALYFPVGMEELYKCRLEIADRGYGFVTRVLQAEYEALLMALRESDTDFSILETVYPTPPGLVGELLRRGFRFTPFPQLICNELAFPRDFATALPDGNVLVEAKTKDKLIAKGCPGEQLVLSPYGEGGRIHLRGNTALVTERISGINGFGTRNPVAGIRQLESAGIRVGVLPNTKLFETGTDGRRVESAFGPEDHLDRIGCLIEAKDGKLHFIMDQRLSAWQRDLNSSETRQEFERILTSIDITLHTVNTTVPMSTGLIQLASGKIIMTSGDKALETLVRELVGSKRVFATRIPFRWYPVLSKAGLHCLINELPQWMFDCFA